MMIECVYCTWKPSNPCKILAAKPGCDKFGTSRKITVVCDKNCSFFKTKDQLENDLQKSNARIRALPNRAADHIELKYPGRQQMAYN